MILFNDKLEVTDHDLQELAVSWEQTLRTEVGNKRAFAAGFRIALREVRRFNKNNCVHPYSDVTQDEFGLKCTKCNAKLTD